MLSFICGEQKESVSDAKLLVKKQMPYLRIGLVVQDMFGNILVTLSEGSQKSNLPFFVEVHPIGQDIEICYWNFCQLSLLMTSLCDRPVTLCGQYFDDKFPHVIKVKRKYIDLQTMIFVFFQLLAMGCIEIILACKCNFGTFSPFFVENVL